MKLRAHTREEQRRCIAGQIFVDPWTVSFFIRPKSFAYAVANKVGDVLDLRIRIRSLLKVLLSLNLIAASRVVAQKRRKMIDTMKDKINRKGGGTWQSRTCDRSRRSVSVGVKTLGNGVIRLKAH